MNEERVCMGIDIGERNFGYSIITRHANDIYRVSRMGTKDFKGDTVKDTVSNMIIGFHGLIQEFEGQNLVVAIELQGKMVAKNRIYQHAICAYIDTRQVIEKGWIPTSKFIEPRDKFRVSAENGKLKLLARDQVEVIKTHGNRKKEAVQRAKQLMPLLLERPEEALHIQDGMNDHMADALLTGLYTLMRADEPQRRKRKRKESTIDKEKSEKKAKAYVQWSF